MISTQYVKLNMVPSGVLPVLYCSQYDIGRPLGMTVYNGGEAVDLDGYTCAIEATRTDGTAITAAVTTDNNIGAFVTTATMTNQADKYPAKLVLFDSNSRRVASLAFMLCVMPATMDENAESIEEDASLYQQYTGTVQTIIAQIRGDLAAEIAARQNAISAEASARQAADNTLQSNINAEASTRAAANQNLQAQINQIIAPSGEAPSAAEVENARIGSDGTVYPTLGDAIRTQNSLLKSHLQDISNLFIYEQPSITKDSGLMLLPVATGDSITIERIDGQTFSEPVQLRFYDGNRAYILYMSTIPATATSRTFTYSGASDAAYIGITDVNEGAGKYIVINNSSKSLLLAEIKARKSADDTLTNNLGILDEQVAKRDVANRFNPSTITEGVYLNPNTGTLISGSGFFASDFIYIGDLETVKVSYTHIVIWADENKNWIGHPDNMNSGAAQGDLTYTIPENAKYIRFSAYNTGLDKAQVGENISRDHYVSHDVYTLPGLVVDESQITEGSGVVVAADGSGDYTSFTLAVKENYNNNKPITVMPGTYNIVAEYVAIWGQSAVDSMADADSAVFDGWQYGVRMGGKKFTFMPGSHLVCDWTGHTVDGTHRFSALRVETDVEIIGLDLDCTATFYAIHDDYGTNVVPYTVRYENCRVIGHSLVNADCIGGGCKKYSRHIIKNCYFDNNLTNSATVRYHNTNAEGAEPEIYVSNTYFNNWFTPRWYGTQTSKMKVYVNNCEARSIHKMAESSSYNVDNVELYKWCNTETAPVT